MKRWTYEKVKEYIEEFGHKLLSDEYKNNYTKLLVQCPLGHKYEVTFNSFKDSNSRCPYCSGKVKHSYEYVKDYIESFGYKLLSDEYKNSRTKLLVECPNGHIWETKYNSFQQGSRCPICNVSKGEQRIIDWLNKNNIEYIYEKTFEELLGINNGLLSYDFYLPKYNLLIEYQGNYHDGTAGNQSEKELETQQEHDRRKRLYTRKNNIQLLEIWYWDFENIEKILSDTLEEVQ